MTRLNFVGWMAVFAFFLVATILVFAFAAAHAGGSRCRAGIGAASYPGDPGGVVVFLPKGCTP